MLFDLNIRSHLFKFVVHFLPNTDICLFFIAVIFTNVHTHRGTAADRPSGPDGTERGPFSTRLIAALVATLLIAVIDAIRVDKCSCLRKLFHGLDCLQKEANPLAPIGVNSKINLVSRLPFDINELSKNLFLGAD